MNVLDELSYNTLALVSSLLINGLKLSQNEGESLINLVIYRLLIGKIN